MILLKNSYIRPQLEEVGTSNYEIKYHILKSLEYATENFHYDTIEELEFEIALRDAIVSACYALLKSNMTFEVFKKSKCNTHYWIRTANGGFQLRNNVSPSKAIRDIYTNGALYATECATAMIIVLYGALLELYDDETFDALFPKIHLYTWNYGDKMIIETKTHGSLIIGDMVYFKNPQVDLHEPEWQGENVVVLGNNTFYGHGLGIKTSQEIIFFLNLKRYPHSFISAYLTDLNTRFNFHKMHQYANKRKIKTVITTTSTRQHLIIAKIGQQTFVTT